jgi:hypothetical protein
MALLDKKPIRCIIPIETKLYNFKPIIQTSSGTSKIMKKYFKIFTLCVCMFGSLLVRGQTLEPSDSTTPDRKVGSASFLNLAFMKSSIPGYSLVYVKTLPDSILTPGMALGESSEDIKKKSFPCYASGEQQTSIKSYAAKTNMRICFIEANLTYYDPKKFFMEVERSPIPKLKKAVTDAGSSFFLGRKKRVAKAQAALDAANENLVWVITSWGDRLDPKTGRPFRSDSGNEKTNTGGTGAKQEQSQKNTNNPPPKNPGVAPTEDSGDPW